MYSCYARRVSFEINSNSKEIRQAEHEYMNKHSAFSVLVTSLIIQFYRFLMHGQETCDLCRYKEKSDK